MRCIALGQAWQDNGGEVVFISCCESKALRERISEEGFQFFPIIHSYPHPEDLSCTLNFLQKLQPVNNNLLPTAQWLVIDGYHFDSTYQKSIKDAGHRLLSIDDYGHVQHYYADIILNQNISADELFYANREPCTRLLLGTSYALLRREFEKWQGWQREISPIGKKVLVTLGGGDPNNFTQKIIKALKQTSNLEIEAKIVVGPANPNMQALIREIGDRSHLEIAVNVTNMPDLMAWADIAITGGGSTCWEMALMGLPNIIFVLADNQNNIAKGLHHCGAAINLGRYDQVTVSHIATGISKLIESKVQRTNISQTCHKLVDGKGALRLVNAIRNHNSEIGLDT